MVNGKKDYPRPNIFPYDEVFYDDGEISIMCGKYKEDDWYSLGMRWNVSESELGYPNVFGRSMWMVVPEKIAIHILEGLLNDENEKDCFINRKLAQKYLDILKEQLDNGR